MVYGNLLLTETSFAVSQSFSYCTILGVSGTTAFQSQLQAGADFEFCNFFDNHLTYLFWVYSYGAHLSRCIFQDNVLSGAIFAMNTTDTETGYVLIDCVLSGNLPTSSIFSYTSNVFANSITASYPLTHFNTYNCPTASPTASRSSSYPASPTLSRSLLATASYPASRTASRTPSTSISPRPSSTISPLPSSTPAFNASEVMTPSLSFVGTSPGTPTQPAGAHAEDSQTGLIVGASIGGVLGVLALIVLGVCMFRWYRRRRYDEQLSDLDSARKYFMEVRLA